MDCHPGAQVATRDAGWWRLNG